jgi:hypothetical protein
MIFGGKPVKESGGTHQGKGQLLVPSNHGDLGGGAEPAKSESEGLVGILQLGNPASGVRRG